MVDGKYQIEIDTPLGHKPGTVVMRSEGNTVVADIDIPIVGKQHVTGALDGDKFSSEGVFKLKFVGNVSYNLNGQVVGDDLSITINSSKGVFEVSGTRV